MCLGNLFGRPRAQQAPPVQKAPTPAPPPEPVVQAPVDLPTEATPGPSAVDDESKKPTKITAKKINKKARAAGTSQLAIKKPVTGGVKGTGSAGGATGGVNTGAKPKTP